MRFVRTFFRFGWGVLTNLSMALVLLLLMSDSTIAQANSFDVRLSTVASTQRFDIVDWVIRSLVRKVGDRLSIDPSQLSEAERKELALRYFKLAHEEEELRGKLLQRRAQSAPASELKELEAQLTRKRADKLALERNIEEIIAAWVGQSALNEGLVSDWPLVAGKIFPPPLFKFVAPPQLLVLSYRERIETKRTVHLSPALSLSEIEAIEADAEKLGVSALVVGLGGIGTYPTMVLETSLYEWTLDVTAHEWVHNYLNMRPLGWHYSDNGRMTTINETAANMAGNELGRRIRGEPPPEYEDDPEEAPARASQPPKPQEFSFNREMRQTRLQVDELLQAGQVEEAEAYMEVRRKLFVARGYNLRKLNQAYFAFYGSYADGGVGAVNPIGGELKRLRKTSGSLKIFLESLSRVSNFEEYRALLKEKGVPEGKR